jgi:hypothetical protein
LAIAAHALRLATVAFAAGFAARRFFAAMARRANRAAGAAAAFTFDADGVKGKLGD